jgi:hypothetical protein
MAISERGTQHSNDSIPETPYITKEDILNAPGGLFNLKVAQAETERGSQFTLREYEDLEDRWAERNLK